MWGVRSGGRSARARYFLRMSCTWRMGRRFFLLLRRMGLLGAGSGANSLRNLIRHWRAMGPRGHLRSFEPLPRTVATPLSQSMAL